MEGEGKMFDDLIEDLMNVYKDLNMFKLNNVLDDFLCNFENFDDILKFVDLFVLKNVNMLG